MIKQMMRQVFGPKRIHSQVVKPLVHRGIYNHRDYVRIMLAEEQAEGKAEEEESLESTRFFFMFFQFCSSKSKAKMTFVFKKGKSDFSEKGIGKLLSKSIDWFAKQTNNHYSPYP
ncbi:hypothetical protein [Desmospora profundinema]|uniref:Uncharacterized protein n=1 Tax=Desmospora profundinema TaxID=1571184 RepID=A0ABU1II34_9BACL|nr:hypothetical protein [Desmospora profundinema]MDR6224428.1 hypothetical protein [Desmospora profundinema]